MRAMSSPGAPGFSWRGWGGSHTSRLPTERAQAGVGDPEWGGILSPDLPTSLGQFKESGQSLIFPQAPFPASQPPPTALQTPECPVLTRTRRGLLSGMTPGLEGQGRFALN